MNELYLQELFNKDSKIIITGGCGFIGGSLIRRLLLNTNANIFNLDKLGYASDYFSINNLIKDSPNDIKGSYKFLNTDLSDFKSTLKVIGEIEPNYIFHLAAESHVDRSIDNSEVFINSNILGTYNLLEAVRKVYKNYSQSKKLNFRLHHISTDEVYGSLGSSGKFHENTKYDPRSPYSASKACSDHLVNAWFHTYELPIIITNCSNNYGPRQFPEKLIPLIISKALKNESIPIYGNGENIRDWLYVEDHIDALLTVASRGKISKNYCIGGSTEKTNVDVCKNICNILDEILPRKDPYESLISFVKDRPGHDKRYAVDTSLIHKELGWFPKHTFKDGLRKTVCWYLNNQDWCEKVII